MTMSAETIGSGIWHVEFRRPAKRNALGVELYAQLEAVFRSIGVDAGARAVVLSGQGETFCAGNDLAEFATEWPQPLDGPVVRFLRALHELPIPVVAGVQGAAVGIGATMLLHCDIVIAASDAFLQFPFIDRGVAPEGASSLLLPQRIGFARAMDLLLTGRRVQAEEALALGLVSRVCNERRPDEVAIEAAREIGAKLADAVLATKRLARLGSEAVLSRFDVEIDAINQLLAVSGG